MYFRGTSVLAWWSWCCSDIEAGVTFGSGYRWRFQADRLSSAPLPPKLSLQHHITSRLPTTSWPRSRHQKVMYHAANAGPNLLLSINRRCSMKINVIDPSRPTPVLCLVRQIFGANREMPPLALAIFISGYFQGRLGPWSGRTARLESLTKISQIKRPWICDHSGWSHLDRRKPLITALTLWSRLPIP